METSNEVVKQRPPSLPERLGAVREVVSEMERAFGKGSVMVLGSEQTLPIEVIPSGSLALDQATGIGGYPRGRIVEIFGPESSGKTTLTLHAMANVQRAGGIAAFIDAEHAFDARYAATIGVRPGQLVVSQPDYGEQALEIAEHLVRSQAVDLVVIDSVAALVPRAEVEGDMGDVHMGLQARLMSQGLRKLTSLTCKTGTTLMFINQLRHKIGVSFGSPETTTGGNALKFYSSLRLDVRRVGKVNAGEEVVGSRTRVKLVKNKCAPPFSEAEFDIRWGQGIDETTDLLDVGVASGAVEQRGAHFAFSGKSFAQGRERAREVLQAKSELAQAIHSRITELRQAAMRAAGEPSRDTKRAESPGAERKAA